MRQLRILAILLFWSWSVLGFCKEITLPPQHIHEFNLQNGLKLIVRQDKRAPVVVSYVWYRVGSADEYGGVTGISHILEHMMFKGTPKHPGNTFSRLIAEVGGKENAFTSTDYTAYYQELSADNLELSFKLESDRMQNLVLDPKEYAKEIEVVKEERRMRIDDNPNALTYERFNAAANIANPYHHLTIGWMSDLNQITIEDLKHWYQRWYAPNNAIVVVVGDVDPQKTYQLAKKYFGPLKASQLPKRKNYPEPKPLGPRRLVVNAPAQLPILLIGYNVPSLNTARESWEVYALAILDGILSAGSSSRFTSRLVRGQQIASNISANYDIYNRYDSLFLIQGTPTQKYKVAELEVAILEQIRQLQDAPITQKELKRIKAKIIANYIYNKDSLSNQAFQIGSLESMGISWREIENYLDTINQITPKQIQQVAKKYLVTNRRTIARLNPLPIDHSKPKRSRLKGVRHGH